jgi:hypothetical protein
VQIVKKFILMIIVETYMLPELQDINEMKNIRKIKKY